MALNWLFDLVNIDSMWQTHSPVDKTFLRISPRTNVSEESELHQLYFKRLARVDERARATRQSGQ